MEYSKFEDKNDNYVINEENNKYDVYSEEHVPINPRILLGYGKNSKEYLEIGKINVEKMLDILIQTNHPIKNKSKILDFGCAGGRMLRWIPNYIKDGEYWGCDVAAKAIIWAQQNLGDNFKLFTSLKEPHLPIEDNYFDFIYAGSVFSHIDDLSDAWFLELKRIVKKRGVLYITIQDEHSLDIIMKNDTDSVKLYYKKLFIDNNIQKHLNTKYLKIVIAKTNYSCQVFYNSTYLCNHLIKFFTSVERIQESYGWQSAMVLKK